MAPNPRLTGNPLLNVLPDNMKSKNIYYPHSYTPNYYKTKYQLKASYSKKFMGSLKSVLKKAFHFNFFLKVGTPPKLFLCKKIKTI